MGDLDAKGCDNGPTVGDLDMGDELGDIVERKLPCAVGSGVSVPMASLEASDGEVVSLVKEVMGAGVKALSALGRGVGV